MGKFAAGICKLVYITGCIRNTGQPVAAAIGKCGYRNCGAPCVFLDNLADAVTGGIGIAVTGRGSVAVGVVNLNFVAIGVVNQSQKTVDKVHLVVLVIADHIASGAVLIDFQAQTIFIIVVTSVFAGILGKVMDGTVPIGVFHIGGFIVGICVVLQLNLFHLLHHTKVYPCTHMHAQIQPGACVIIFFAVSHGIAAVIDKIQRHRIDCRGIGHQVFAQSQLSAEIPDIRRTGIAKPHGLIGIVILNTVGAPVGGHKVHLAVVGEPGAVLGTGIRVRAHHQTVIAPTIVPLFRCGCDIPEQNAVDGRIAGIHIIKGGAMIGTVCPGQAAVQGGAFGDLAHVQYHGSAGTVGTGTVIVLEKARLRPYQGMAGRHIGKICQLVVDLHFSMIRVITAR